MNRFTFFIYMCVLFLLPAGRMLAADADSTETDKLWVQIESLSFFKDNEFEGEQAKGYSLPGLWVRPLLAYQPLPAVRLEAGFHALIYAGANKYPCYAYHDIGTWKGHQYQRGAHVLPFFRATARLKDCTFVLGDLYGPLQHGVVEPLLNPELELTQDPEMGFQLLVQRQRYHLDAWINWQSYIFEEDTHQEAFTVGVSQRIHLTPPHRALRFYVPIDVLVQHRGGEQDATDMGVQTLCNAAVGLGMEWHADRRVLNSLSADVLALGAWQQSGHLWPFDTGGGVSCSASAMLWSDFRLFGGLTYVRDFVSLYGIPFYSTLSQKHGARFSSMLTPHVGAEWCHTFARDYTLGAKIDVYPAVAGAMTKADGTRLPSAFSNNFSFGIYLRCSPRFRIK